MEEVYKTIKGFENYEISNLGNCRNKKTNYILKPLPMKLGYNQYSLSYTGDNNKKKYVHQYQHRLIAIYHIENPFNKTDVDHIDGNPSNNDIKNLRWATKNENLSNQKKQHNKTSKYMGVSFDKSRNKWSSKIEVNKIIKYIGRFATEEEAGKARDDFIINNNLTEFFKLNFNTSIKI